MGGGDSKWMRIRERLGWYYLGKFGEDRVIEISYSDRLGGGLGKKNKEKVKEYGGDLLDMDI